MREPTLGCQIAPHYDREQWPYNTESDTTDTESEAESPVREEAVDRELAIEKAETQHSRGITPALSKINTQRSKRSRKDAAQDPVGFWHWQMAGVRLHVLKLWFRTNLILAVAIMAFLCLFWGALFRQNDNVKHLEILVVDFDGQAPYTETVPFVGPFVTEAIQNMTIAGGIVPHYSFHFPNEYDHDPIKVREAVYNMHAWAAVVINPNATSLLNNAVRQGNSTYDPAGACQIIYSSARDQTTTSTYIVPSLSALQTRISSTFGPSWLLQLQPTLRDLLSTAAPQALSPGISFTTLDLRPFGPPIATPAVSIGLIYLIIISFFSFTFFLPIHMKYLSPRGHPPLHFRHLIAWRYIATVSSYFFLSLVYSFVSLAFLMPMSNAPASHVQPARNANAYGRATFMVYWMGNWVGMIAFGLASENMAMMLGTPWTALWLIFWVISNVATGFYALDLAPAFYRWGYAWPMHNIVELTRSTLFDLPRAHVGRNFGILLAWVAVDTLLFPACCYFMRWNTARVKSNAAQAEREWNAKMEKERDAPGLVARVTTRGTRGEGPQGRGKGDV
ncbi:MNNG and nitrosoguanidine resistance protein [Stagonosporopsis vannaccii]|nr:MNNG and nitrosoguanidine resistance protein [Stagonosporopsis vannaccii]